MQYEVSQSNTINYGATGVEEILQNVAFILSTPLFSCCLDREFGWNQGIDAPINVLVTKYVANVTQAIHSLEPRAEVVRVSFEDSNLLAGKLRPKVKVKINDESI